MMRLYLINGLREDLMRFVYDELINHTASIEIQHKTGLHDGTYGIYLRVHERYEKYFLMACESYGIRVLWKEQKAA